MKNTILLLTSLLIFNFALQAQEYTVTTSNAPYVPLDNPTDMLNGMTWDDPEIVLDVPFDFSFMGNEIDSIYFIGLGGLLSGSYPTELDLSIPVMVVYGADIIDRGYEIDDDMGLSPISYQVDGDPGSRILKLQWENVGFYSDVTNNGADHTDYVNFQFWMFEGSNNMAIHHGPVSVTNPELSYDGYTGSHTIFSPDFDFENEVFAAGSIVLQGDPSAPSVNELTEGISYDEPNFPAFDGPIPEGTLYTFDTGGSVSVENLASGKFAMSPNPASSSFVVRGELAPDTEVQIFNALGQLVKSAMADDVVQVDDLARGVYFVQVGSEVERLILR